MTPTATTAAPAQPATIATAPHGTPSAIVAAFALAYQRAANARMIAFKNEDGSYSVPSSSGSGVEHIVRKVGRRWYDWSCSCPGGNHVACMHRAVAVHCEKYHVSAVRPQAPRTWISAETGMAVRFDESPAADADVPVQRSPEYIATMAALITGQDIWA